MKEPTDYYQVDMPGVRYKFVNFRAGKSPGLTNWLSPDRLKDGLDLSPTKCFQSRFAEVNPPRNLSTYP